MPPKDMETLAAEMLSGALVDRFFGLDSLSS